MAAEAFLRANSPALCACCRQPALWTRSALHRSLLLGQRRKHRTVFPLEIDRDVLFPEDAQGLGIDNGDSLFEVSNDQQEVFARVSRKTERTLRVKNRLPQLIAIEPYQPDPQIPNV